MGRKPLGSITNSGVVPSSGSPVALGRSAPVLALISVPLKRLPALPEEMIWPLALMPAPGVPGAPTEPASVKAPAHAGVRPFAVLDVVLKPLRLVALQG